MSEQPVYQPGDQVNGHVWTGTQWLPIAAPVQPASRSPWRTVAGVVAIIVAGLAVMQGLSWIGSSLELDSEGNPFAGFLTLLGMGALVVGAAFGITGVVLLTKKS